MERECNFCKKYNFIVEYDKQYPNSNFSKRYKAKLVAESFNKKDKQIQSIIEYELVTLHYCPYCVKKLR